MVKLGDGIGLCCCSHRGTEQQAKEYTSEGHRRFSLAGFSASN
jgi:hypothetical protein